MQLNPVIPFVIWFSFFFVFTSHTLGKLVCIVHFGIDIHRHIHIFPVQHNDRNHNHEYILECRHRLDLIHSHDYKSIHSAQCNYLYRMVDYKRVYTVYPFYRVGILVGKRTYSHYIVRYRMLKTVKFLS